jgi:hypothetical protein
VTCLKAAPERDGRGTDAARARTAPLISRALRWLAKGDRKNAGLAKCYLKGYLEEPALHREAETT